MKVVSARIAQVWWEIHVRRLLAVIAFCTCIWSPALADTFMGRTIQVTDGRQDLQKPAPLVLALHGFLGTGRNLRRKSRFDAVARSEGFIVVYPNGRARRWNDGRSPGNRVDDVAFLSSLIAALVARDQVDPARVFVTGHSNGGGMAMRMACDRPDLVRGISVVATKSALNYQCRGGPPVAALFVHGTADPISPHQGRGADSRLGGALSSRDTLSLWQGRNRCNGRPQMRVVDRVDDGTVAEVLHYSGCAAPLQAVVIKGHGHGWPGPAARKTLLEGPATREVDATRMTWSFFSGL